MADVVTLDDVWKSFQETDRRMREMAVEADHRMRDAENRMRETESLIREMSAQTDRKIEEVSRQIGRLGGRLGEYIEEMIKPACIAMFQGRGIPVDEVFSRVKKSVAGERMEIDLLLANTVAAVLIEVKSHLTAEHVQEHLVRLDRFKPLFPRYADCRVYGAVAGMVIASDADRFAMSRGLFVIAQTGSSVCLANAPDFVPRSW